MTNCFFFYVRSVIYILQYLFNYHDIHLNYADYERTKIITISRDGFNLVMLYLVFYLV